MNEEEYKEENQLNVEKESTPKNINTNVHENNFNQEIKEEQLAAEPEINFPPDVKEPSEDKKQINLSEDKNVFAKKIAEESIDLSQIKKKTISFFENLTKKGKKLKEKSNERNKDDGEEVSFDFKKVINYTKNNAKWILPLLFILIAIFLSSYFRMMPSSLPATDDWAENSVHNFYRQQISAQINQQYPNLPQQNRDALVEKEFQAVLENNQEMIQQQIKENSLQLKTKFQDDNGDTYLLAIDPYLWYGEGRNVINHGHLGDSVNEQGIESYSLRNGRLDKTAFLQLHPYIGAYLFKFLSFFNKNISLMRAFFLLPVIIIGLALIPAFFIGRRLAGDVGGFFAAVFLAINAPLLGRTPAGFADTDPYNILFPLLIAWFFIEAYYTKKAKMKYGFLALSGLFIGLYSITWSGWSYSFLFIFATISLAIIYDLVKNVAQNKFKINKETLNFKIIKNKLLILVGFTLSSGIFITLFKDFGIFTGVFARVIKFTTLKEVGIKSIWPNVLTTVAEFNASSFSNIISQMGGELLFWLGLMGIVFLLFNYKKVNPVNIVYLISSGVYYGIMLSFTEHLNNHIIFLIVICIPLIIGAIKIIYLKEEINLLLPILIALWLLGTAYAFTKGIRFAILLAPPFVLALGTALGTIYNAASHWLSQGINLNKRISQILVFLVLTLLLITPLSSATTIAKNEVPSMNDAWYNTLTKIKNDSADAIITSWWDFGHWFVAIAERRVTFDGGDQGERVHWVGRTLRTDNEAESVGILRMLNCVQEQAPHKLDEFTQDSLESVNILYHIFPIAERNKALQKYQELGLSKEEADVMIEYTHCQDLIPNYYITSEDMVGKAGVWGHFGSWDFRRAVMYQNTNKLSKTDAVTYLTENFNLTEDEAYKIHNEIQTTPGDHWISPWPGYHSRPSTCETFSEDQIRCTGSIQESTFILDINLRTMEVSFQGNKEAVPNSLVYATKNSIEEKKFPGQKVGFSVVLIPYGEKYQFMVTDPLQANSIFTKLFFFDGHSLECFSKFDDVRGITGGRVITWKVDYDCQQKNQVFFLPEKIES